MEAMHEAGESPQQEAIEHMPGEYEAGGESPEAHMGAGEGGEDVDHLLSQLSPEELDHLATMLAGDMQHPGGAGGMGEAGMEDGEHEGGADTHALAQAIQAHLAENPEANPEGAAPEKMAALDFVKSASYIEGFLEQAIERGASVKEAVDIYDSALSRSIQSLDVEKTAARGKYARRGANRVAKPFTTTSVEHHPVAKGTSSVSQPSKVETATHTEPAKSTETAKEKSNVGRNVAIGVGTGVAVGGAAYAANRKKDDDSEKTAAYYEGVLERAREYGLSDQEALRFVKSANAFSPSNIQKLMASVPKSAPKNYDLLEQLKYQLHRNRGKVGLGAGLVGGGALGSYLSDDK